VVGFGFDGVDVVYGEHQIVDELLHFLLLVRGSVLQKLLLLIIGRVYVSK
jgi:hypothetical protein